MGHQPKPDGAALAEAQKQTAELEAQKLEEKKKAEKARISAMKSRFGSSGGLMDQGQQSTALGA